MPRSGPDAGPFHRGSASSSLTSTSLLTLPPEDRPPLRPVPGNATRKPAPSGGNLLHTRGVVDEKEPGRHRRRVPASVRPVSDGRCRKAKSFAFRGGERLAGVVELVLYPSPENVAAMPVLAPLLSTGARLVLYDGPPRTVYLRFAAPDTGCLLKPRRVMKGYSAWLGQSLLLRSPGGESWFALGSVRPVRQHAPAHHLPEVPGSVRQQLSGPPIQNNAVAADQL